MANENSSLIISYYNRPRNTWDEETQDVSGVDYSDPVGAVKKFLADEIIEFKSPEPESESSTDYNRYPGWNIISSALGIGRSWRSGEVMLKAGGDKLEGSVHDFIEGGFDLAPKAEVIGAITTSENRLPFRGMGPDQHIIGVGFLRFTYNVEYLGKVGPKKYQYDCPVYYRIKPDPFMVPWIVVIGPRYRDVFGKIPTPFTSYGRNVEKAAHDAYKHIVKNAKKIGGLSKQQKLQELHKIIDRLLELEVMGVEFDPKESPIDRARKIYQYGYGDRVEIEVSRLLDRYKELTGKTPEFLEENIVRIADIVTDHPDIMGQ